MIWHAYDLLKPDKTVYDFVQSRRVVVEANRVKKGIISWKAFKFNVYYLFYDFESFDYQYSFCCKYLHYETNTNETLWL